MIHPTRYIVLTHRKANEEFHVDSMEELRFMLDAVAGGRVRSIESRGDTLGTLIEMSADSPQEAQALADELPGVKAGLEKAIVIPLGEYAPFRALADVLI